MRILPLLLSTSMLLLASSAGAQNLPYPPPDASAVNAVVVTGSTPVVRLRDEEARQIAGTYDMSNGWRLKVRPSSRSIDATIDRQKPMRLVAVTPSKFVSGDGNVTMEFNRGDLGDEMTMSYSPAPGIADVVVISSAIAQR